MAKAVLHFYAQLYFSTVTLIQPTDIRKTKALLKPPGFASTALHQSALILKSPTPFAVAKVCFGGVTEAEPTLAFPSLTLPLQDQTKGFFVMSPKILKASME